MPPTGPGGERSAEISRAEASASDGVPPRWPGHEAQQFRGHRDPGNDPPSSTRVVHLTPSGWRASDDALSDAEPSSALPVRSPGTSVCRGPSAQEEPAGTPIQSKPPVGLVDCPTRTRDFMPLISGRTARPSTTAHRYVLRRKGPSNVVDPDCNGWFGARRRRDRAGCVDRLATGDVGLRCRRGAVDRGAASLPWSRLAPSDIHEEETAELQRAQTVTWAAVDRLRRVGLAAECRVLRGHPADVIVEARPTPGLSPDRHGQPRAREPQAAILGSRFSPGR